MEHRLTTPLTKEAILKLKAGDILYLTGKVFTARDEAHKHILDTLSHHRKLPFDLTGAVIYHCGPLLKKTGNSWKVVSAGPTTSGRMDSYAPRLMSIGLKGMIGKGNRSQEVKDAIKKYKAIYFGAIGGAGALISKSIKKAEVIAYEDLGAEAIRRLEVENFPATVINDIHGRDLYEEGKAKYQVKV